MVDVNQNPTIAVCHLDRNVGRAREECAQGVDRLACEAWNMRMLGYKGPAQPFPSLGDALNAGFRYLEVRFLGCDTNQTVAHDIVRRSRNTTMETSQ
jgi:hypothetical protein